MHDGATFTMVLRSLLTSSLWTLPHGTPDDRRHHAVRIVWITLMLSADKHGYVHSSIPGLATAAVASIEDVEYALEVFRAPDKYSRTKDLEGRRIVDVDGGWLLINYKPHLEKLKAEAAKKSKRDWYERNREAVSAKRAEQVETVRDVSLTLDTVRPNEPVLTTVRTELDGLFTFTSTPKDLDPDRARDCPQVEPADPLRGELDWPCTHPKREGRHEVYVTGEGLQCRACGATGPLDESPPAPVEQSALAGQPSALPGLPRAAVSIAERPVEAEGQREVVRSLKGFAPDEALYAEALALGVTRESFDRRLKDLARGPVGGTRGIFRDELRGYVQGQFKTWKVWDETDRFKASQGRAGPGLAKTQGDGSEVERWLPDARHRELARKLKLDAFEELLPEYRRTALPRGQTSAEIDKHFAGWLKERAKAKRAQKGAA